MMNKDTTALAYGVVMATIYAVLATSVVYGIWQGLHLAPISFVFVCLWVGFCLALIWRFYRKDELDRKFPISAAEHRRRKREFYAWLRRSQPRR
jgi:Ni/Fe-hydrogenase subunit HybB-like protein